MVPTHNNGLIYVTRATTKPELMGQSVIINIVLFVISLGLTGYGNWAGQKPQQAGPRVTHKDIFKNSRRFLKTVWKKLSKY